MAYVRSAAEVTAEVVAIREYRALRAAFAARGIPDRALCILAASEASRYMLAYRYGSIADSETARRDLVHVAAASGAATIGSVSEDIHGILSTRIAFASEARIRYVYASASGYHAGGCAR